jgi:hypothetical protein
MGDTRFLTTQELAEFIDPIEPVGSLDETGDFADRDPETFASQLP